MKKTLALILALALLLGCVSFASAEGTMNRDGLTFPELPNNTLKLTVTTANWGTDQLPTKMQKLWQEKMEEYLGCKLDITWQIAPWNDFRNNESVNLAAGDLSDINTYSQGTLVNGYGKDEDGDSLVLDIMDYKDYLVYYPEFVEGKAGGWNGVLNDDGTSYVFWDGYDNDLNLAGGQSFSAYAYRFDVLKKYDLKPATTWEEFKALCAFLKEKIDAGEIENAKYVMSNGASWMAFFRGFVGTFHTWDTTYWNGTEWAFGPIEDNFRTMLKEMHELYAAGYIDPEYATDESCDAKAANGNILIVPTNWAGSVQSWNQAKVSEDMEWGLAYLPSSQFGTAWKWGSKLNGKNLGTTLTMGIIISADTEYPEYVVRLIDYQYSEDIYKMLNWGVEGEDFVTLEDGTRTYVDEILNAENPGQALADRGIMASASARTGIPFVPQIFSTILQYSSTEPWWSAEKGYYDGKYWIDTAVNGGPDSISPYDRAPLTHLNEEESKMKSTLTSACEKYSKVGANQFITGELDINDDAAWEAYVAGVKSQTEDFDGFFKTLNEKTDIESLQYYK